MKRLAVRLALMAAFAMAATIAFAQSAPNCAEDSPCQSVPWRLPALPNLITPTPFPTVVITAVGTSTPVPTATTAPGTPTTAPTAIGGGSALDVSGVAGPLATIGALSQSTPVHLSDLNGSYAEQDNASAFGQQAGTFFGYVRGLASVNFGILTPLLFFVLGGFVITLGLKLTSVFLPVIAVLIGIVRKVVSLILDFLPL